MENNNRQGCRWTNGRKKELLPPIDNDDFPKKYVVRVYGDDPHSGCVYCGMETSKQMRDVNEDGYWEWLDESIEPCATSSENYWKQRCEAAELVIEVGKMPSAEYYSKGLFPKKVFDAWQQLKSKTIPTGDRDCEELKMQLDYFLKDQKVKHERISELEKEVERLKGLVEYWQEQYNQDIGKYNF